MYCVCLCLNCLYYYCYGLDKEERPPVFVLSAMLLIPKVGVQPDLEEVQEVLNLAGKNITAVSKGIGQWAANQEVSLLL